uniref:Uncharacterized protein n=1 Tax=Arundo donax TaxID=35708 RepID=A0A0A8ZEE6_ARUDO
MVSNIWFNEKSCLPEASYLFQHENAVIVLKSYD